MSLGSELSVFVEPFSALDFHTVGSCCFHDPFSHPSQSNRTEIQSKHHLPLKFSPLPQCLPLSHICWPAGRHPEGLLSIHCLLIVCSSLSLHAHTLISAVCYKNLLTNSTLHSLPLFSSHWLFWPFDRDVVRLQLLLRHQVRGAAHEVIAPE